MAANRTFKDIIQTIEMFSTNHAKLNTFQWGHVDDISTRETEFPLMFAQPNSSNITDNIASDSFDLYFTDLLMHNQENKLYIISEMKEVANDFITTMRNYDDDIDIKNTRMEIFIGDFDDLTAGVVLHCDISYYVTMNECIIPHE